MKSKWVRGFSAMFICGIVAACSGTAANSSSSHWETCETGNDCAEVSGSVGCDAGYCVDSSGDRIEGGGGGSNSCDPFAAPIVTLELGTIIGAAENVEGTLYVVDVTADDVERLFISVGDKLARVRILGTGTGSTETGEFATYTFEQGGTQFTLLFETAGGTPRATLTEGMTKPGAPGGAPTVLTAVDEGTVYRLPIEGWANSVLAEYYAEVESGERVVVTRPEEDWSYEDFRLFSGSGGTLTEREVTNVTRAKDGGSTHIEFDLDGEAADLYFPFEEAATLTVGSSEKSVTLLEGEPGSDVSYECL